MSGNNNSSFLFTESFFRKIAVITVLSVFVLIFLGGVVRSTGSGMGCPDWPTCFGKIVPPTDVSELPAGYREIFRKGTHEVAEFNVFKTWTEYVNRLFGAITGLLFMITMISSWQYVKKQSRIFYLSVGSFILVGLQGWIGAKVVDTNLAGWMVTIHMMLALVIAALIIYTVTLTMDISFFSNLDAKQLGLLKLIAVTAIISSAFQIVIGTQVREQLDKIAIAMGGLERGSWISQLGSAFITHRAFSIVSFLLNIGLAYLVLRTNTQGIAALYAKLLGVTVTVQMLTGFALAYFSIPPVAQTLHILFGSMVAGIEVFLALMIFNKSKSAETLKGSAQMKLAVQ
jgi:cytochrome c oxidase assembly protein subunit 15